MKTHISIRVDGNLVDFADNIAELNEVSRSRVFELALELVSDYFSDNQIKNELLARGKNDGRFKQTGPT